MPMNPVFLPLIKTSEDRLSISLDLPGIPKNQVEIVSKPNLLVIHIGRHTCSIPHFPILPRRTHARFVGSRLLIDLAKAADVSIPA